jgi:hypothetical protein
LLAFVDNPPPETTAMGPLTKGHRVGLVSVIAALAACGHSPPHRGGIDFIATLPAGSPVEMLTFKLTGPGYGGLAGGIHVSKPQQEFEKLINGVPVGDDYDLELSAPSLDGQLTCKGSAKVSVRFDTITRVHVPLKCGPGDGVVLINVGVVAPRACTGVSLEYMVSPLTTPVGGIIFVTASADSADASALTYDWTAPSGQFSDPMSSHTTYRCAAAGNITLSLRVATSDCAEDQSVNVDCVGSLKDASAD